MKSQLRLEAYNAFNHTNYNTINTTMPTAPTLTSTFGQVTGARDPRIVQLGFKLNF